MNESVSTPGLLIWPLFAVAIFVILFAAILAAIRESGMFGRKTGAMVALCVTLLCLLGLHETFVGAPRGTTAFPGREGIGVDFLLIPYAALALTILSVLLLVLLHKLRNGRPRKGLGHTKIIRSEHPDSRRERRDLLREPSAPVSAESGSGPDSLKKKSYKFSTNKEIQR